MNIKSCVEFPEIFFVNDMPFANFEYNSTDIVNNIIDYLTQTNSYDSKKRMRFRVNRMDVEGKESLMLVLNEEDILDKCVKFIGCGYEFIILPMKYKDIILSQLDVVKEVTRFRSGEMLYV